MSKQKIILIDELSQRNDWCNDYLERTLDCKKNAFFVTIVVNGQSRPVFDIFLWSEEWRMVRQDKPKRKCNLLKNLNDRKENKIPKDAVPDSYFI